MAGRSTFWTNVSIIAATLTFLGGVLTSIIALVGSARQTENQAQSEICRMAYDAIADDSPSPHVTVPEARAFMVMQLRLAQKCAERKW
jgi:hypothetical protein